MIKWDDNDKWINKDYFNNLQKWQMVESIRQNPDKLFAILNENTKMREEIIVLKRQMAEKNRP